MNPAKKMITTAMTFEKTTNLLFMLAYKTKPVNTKDKAVLNFMEIYPGKTVIRNGILTIHPIITNAPTKITK